MCSQFEVQFFIFIIFINFYFLTFFYSGEEVNLARDGMKVAKRFDLTILLSPKNQNQNQN